MLWWQQSASLCHDSMSRRSIQHHVTSACHLCYTWRLLSRHMNNRCTWRDDKSTALHKTFFPQLPFSLPCRLWQSRAQVHPAEDAACCWRERDFSLSQGPCRHTTNCHHTDTADHASGSQSRSHIWWGFLQMPVLHHISDSSDQLARSAEKSATRLWMHDSLSNCNLWCYQSSERGQFEH